MCYIFGMLVRFRHCLLALVPLVELGALRWLYHYGMEWHLGWQWGVTDADLFVPAAIAGIAWALSSPTPLVSRFSGRSLILHTIALAVHFGITALLVRQSAFSEQACFLAWALSVGFVAFSCLAVFFPLRSLLPRGRILEILPSMAIASAILIHNQWPENVWLFPLEWTSKAVQAWLFLFPHEDVSIQVLRGHLILIHPRMALEISKNCGGGDAIFYFLGALALAVSSAPQNFKLKHLFLLIPMGLVYMFLLNVIRILLIFHLSIWFGTWWNDRQAGTRLALALFHLHTGWVLYTMGILLFFWAYRHIKRPGFRFLPRLASYSRALTLLLLTTMLTVAPLAFGECGADCIENFEPADDLCSAPDICPWGGACAGKCSDCTNETLQGDCESHPNGIPNGGTNTTGCIWTGSSCIDITGVPELPVGTGYRWLVWVLVALGLGSRTRARRLGLR